MQVADYLGLAYIVVAILTYVGIVAWLLIDPDDDEEKWSWLGLGIVVAPLWLPVLVVGFLFGMLEAVKALHRWIHRPRAMPVPKTTPAIPDGKLDVTKD